MKATDPVTAERKAEHGGKLESVQVLRAVAAMAVVIGHIIGLAAMEGPSIGWSFERPMFASGAGVDLFFLISGFIMVVASGRLFAQRGAAGEFLLRRLVRIVPLYWTMTLLNLPIVFFFASHEPPSALGVATSFLFFPFDTAGLNNGFAFPVLDLGWTLNYEMFFYLLFALFIGWSRERCVMAVCAVLTAFVILGAFIDPSIVPLHFWSRPIVLEFGAGMVVALLLRRGALAFPPAVRIALVAASLAWLVIDPMSRSVPGLVPNDFGRVIGWGVPSALTLVAAISGPVPLSGSFGRAAVRVGDASYALYLTHPFVVRAGIMFLRKVPVGPAIGPVAFIVVMVVASVVAAIAVHLLFERPVTDWLVERLRRLRAPITRSPMVAEGTPK